MRTTDYPMAAEVVEKYLRLRPEDPWGYYIKGWLIFLQANSMNRFHF